MSSCYHPLRAIRTYNVDNVAVDGKVPKSKITILKGEYDPKNVPLLPPHSEYIPIPCGRCIGCRLQYSREWADRCMLEASYHKDNWFLTLTYDDSHLPECRPGSPVHSLVKRDLQLFMKRLRKTFSDQKIRFFACGEYGPKNLRPHYHLILFGLKLDDLVIQRRDVKQGFIYYSSPTIDRIWNKGFHLITNVTWDTCAYTARYVMKKQKGAGSSIYEEYNFQSEFTLMSRKPGLGRQFYEDHPDIVVKSYYIPKRDGHITVNSNRYFDRLFDGDYYDTMDSIKFDRAELARKNELLKSNLTSLSYLEQLHDKELIKETVTKVLKRKEL